MLDMEKTVKETYELGSLNEEFADKMIERLDVILKS